MKAAKKRAPDYFLRKWFHSMGKPNDLGWQGQIVRALPDGESYMVQLYSWLDGCPTIVKKVSVGEMDGWRLYDTNAEMNNYSEYFWKHVAK